jgi:hypothetical protein
MGLDMMSPHLVIWQSIGLKSIGAVNSQQVFCYAIHQVLTADGCTRSELVVVHSHRECFVERSWMRD